MTKFLCPGCLHYCESDKDIVECPHCGSQMIGEGKSSNVVVIVEEKE